MARQPSAPAALPPVATVTGASVLPGMPLPDWALPPAAAAPPEPEPAYEPEPVLAPEPAHALAPELVTVGAPESLAYAPAPIPVSEDVLPTEPAGGVTPTLPPTVPPAPVGPDLAYAPALPVLSHEAWDEPAATPQLGSHHLAPASESTGRSGRGRLLVLLGLVVVVAAAFAAFVTPGFLVASEEEQDVQVVVPHQAAPAVSVKPVGGYAVDPAGADAAKAAAADLASLGLSSPVAVTLTKQGAPTQVVAAAPTPVGGVEAFYTSWEKASGVTKVTKVSGMPRATTARCGSTKVDGASGTACAFTGPAATGTIWYPGTGVKAASELVPATVSSVHAA